MTANARRLAVDGREVRADFSLETVDGQPTLVLESRSGTGRNPDYNLALELLLDGLRNLDASISNAIVDSVISRRVPFAERTLEIRRRTYPIRLRNEPDIVGLRLAIGAAQKSVAQEPGARGGNRHKRIRLFLAGPSFAELTSELADGTDDYAPAAGRSQGRQMNAAQRRATEARSMEVVARAFEADGWSVTDVSRERRGFDLLATRDGIERYVEVKGTVGDGNSVEVTAGEVRWAQTHREATTLAIVSQIELRETKSGWEGREGLLRTEHPWGPVDAELSPVTYRWSRSFS